MLRLLLLPLLWMLTACIATRPGGDAPEISPGEHYLRYGVAAFADGQPETAAVRFRQALELFEETSDREGQVRAHINLAELMIHSRNAGRAAYHLQQAARLNAQMQVPLFRQRIALLESAVAIQQKDYARAQARLDALIESYPAEGESDPLLVAALVNRALVAEATRSADLSQWVNRLKQAVNASASDDPVLGARLQRFDARLAIDNGDFAGADSDYRDALAVYEQSRQRRAVGVTLSEWAGLDIARQRWQPAGEKLKRAILIRDEVADHDGVITDIERLAVVEERLGRNEQAQALRRFATALRNDASSAPHVRQFLDSSPNQ